MICQANQFFKFLFYINYMSKNNTLPNNPMPFNLNQNNLNPTDFYSKSKFTEVDTLVAPYFERNIIQNPVKDIIPDQTSFAKYLFPNTAKCRDTGYLCKVEAINERQLNRLSFEKN
jgi:hypothetical protein